MSNKRKAAEAASQVSSPSTKRKRDSKVPNTASSESPVSRQASNSLPQQRQHPKNDPRFGQKFAFPGLDDGSEEGLLMYDGEPTDGLEYLRNVRSEAKKLPAIMNAEMKEKLSAHGAEDITSDAQDEESDIYDEGTYFDGIWVAPSSGAVNAAPYENDADDFDAQEECYASLCHRFEILRHILQETPPADVISSLGSDHPVYFPRRNKSARREWKRLMSSTDPTMAQIACMDLESVLGILDIATAIMADVVESGDVPAVKRLSTWIWGALGKCREVGQLSSDDVSQIRELGKLARQTLDWVKDWEQNGGYGDQNDGDEEHGEEQDAEENEPESDLESIYLPDDLQINKDRDETQEHAGNTNTMDESEALAAAKARLQARLDLQTEDDQSGHCEDEGNEYQEDQYQDDTEWSYATRAMIDMILTIVGEFFGQRDLLEARDIWDEQV
ncbi:hypothetical protein KEM56_005902 [Ascosphaera pollenicola]|nr:hypothetical protein KEM56_005902 [Ascosphaera pollenicola]